MKKKKLSNINYKLKTKKMSKKNIIDTVEGSKVWGYIAMGAAILAGAAIVITVKESMDAKKAAKNLAVAKEELESVKEAVKNGEEVEEVSEESFSGIDQSRYSERSFVSAYRPLRQTYKES